MPTYPCEKCGRVFKQKSGYDDHMSKKTPCEQTSMIAAVIDAKVEEKVKAAVRAVMPKAEITKVTDDTMKAFFEDLHNLLWNKAGLSPERALEHMTFFFAYRLIETQADALQLPQECRWSYLASHKNENDTYETMKKGCVAFQKNKVTKPFFKKPEIDKATIVYDIVQQISRISLTMMQETDTLGDIFEHMLGRGMSTMADEGQYFTNRKICKLAFKLAYDIKKTLRRADGSLCTFADWFCGTGGFPAEFVKGVKVHDPSVDWARDAGALYCQDMNLSSVTTTLLNLLILTGIPFSGHTIRGGNSFTDAITTGAGAPFSGLTVDYCFMNPPYGGDKSKGKDYKFAYSKTVKGDDGGKSKKFFVNQEIQSIGVEDDDKVSAGVQLAMATLSEGGVCCIVLPQGFFFGASKKCVELRRKIAEEYRIHTVVDIASGSFLNTGTKTSMMVFQKGVGATETVTFMGLNEAVLVEATLEELRVKNYSLNYKQYLPQSAMEVDGFEMVKLGSIAKKLTTRGKHSAKDTIENGKYSLFSSSINEIYKLDTFDYTETCCIINSTNASGNAIVNLGKNFSVTSDTFVFKCENDVTTIYIQIYLSSNIHLVKETFQGANHKHPTWDRLSEIQIPLPSLEKQQEIVEQIDFYTQMAHTEEQSLKLLEKIVMGWVKEMGRGKERVKLESILKNVKYPKHPTEYGNECGKFRFHTGAESTKLYTDKPDIDDLVIIVNRTNGSGKCHIFIDNNCSVATQTITFSSTNDITTVFLYYYFKSDISILEAGYQGACHKNLTTQYINDIQIPLPTLAEQQTLQSDFDEIRHKHAKIAEYKAKAQEAIQRLIPGAKDALAADTAAIAAESVTSMSHTSTCEVDEDGYGCTCRVPLEKEDLSTTASATTSATASAAVAIPEVSATAAVRRRPTKVAIAAVVE